MFFSPRGICADRIWSSPRQFRKQSGGAPLANAFHQTPTRILVFAKEEEWRSNLSSKKVGRNYPEEAPNTNCIFLPISSERGCMHSLALLGVAKCTQTGKRLVATGMQSAMRTTHV